MTIDRPAGRLTRHFFRALFDFGVFTQEGADAFVRVVLGLISLLICLGLLLLRMYAKKYAGLFHAMSAEPYRQAVLADTTLAIAFPMWIVAMVAVLVSQSLFPDETDFRVLMPLPIGRGLVFGAKLLALALFAGVFTVTSHIGLTPFVMLISGGPWSVAARPTGILVYWMVSVPASVFALLAVVAVNGAITVCLPRCYVHTATATMRSAMLGALMLALSFVMALPARSVRLAQHSRVMFLVPPAWFMGAARMLLGDDDPYVFALACVGAVAFVSAAAIAVASYVILYRRFDRVMLHALEGSRRASGHRPRRVTNLARAAVRDFTAATLRRSALHQGVIVGLSACGVALAVNSLLRNGVFTWLRAGGAARWGLLSTVAWIPFPLISLLGLAARASLALPIEPKANWVFRMTEREGIRVDQLDTAERMLTLFAALIPIALTLPVQWAVAGPRALLAGALTGVFGLLCVETLLRDWRRIPFTCSYMPGKHSVAHATLAAVLLYLVPGAIGSALEMGALRQPSPVAAVVMVAVLSAVAFALRRWRRGQWRDFPLVFDDELPSDVQILGLTQR
jgi:hypothetical protein